MLSATFTSFIWEGGREGGREQIELISSVNLDANERNLEDKNRTM